jgi:hypothetical protein
MATDNDIHAQEEKVRKYELDIRKLQNELPYEKRKLEDLRNEKRKEDAEKLLQKKKSIEDAEKKDQQRRWAS